MSGREFKNLIQVHEYLDGQGWKISRSGLYNHAQNKWLSPDNDGLYSQVAVNEYARQRLKMKDGSTQRPDRLAQEKREIEVRHLKARTRLVEKKAEVEEGNYVPRSAFEEALASRARLLKNDLHNFAAGEAPEIVSLVGGDRGKIPELIEYLQDQIDGFIDRYSREEEFLV